MSWGFASNSEKSWTPAGRPARKPSRWASASSGPAERSEAAEEFGAEALENAQRPVGAQRRVVRPAGHDLGCGGAQCRGGAAGAAGGEETVGDAADAGDAVGEVRAEVGHVAVHEGGEAGEAVLRRGQRMGLLVCDHLEAVFDLPVGAVVGGEGLRDVVGDPALLRKAGEAVDRAAHAEVGVAAAGDELAGLGEELDLADAAGGKLEVAPLERVAVEALVLADAEPHVVRFLDRRVVEMLAPDEGGEAVEEAVACGDIPRAGARLDVGGALPGAAEAFVVAFGRFHARQTGVTEASGRRRRSVRKT